MRAGVQYSQALTISAIIFGTIPPPAAIHVVIVTCLGPSVPDLIPEDLNPHLLKGSLSHLNNPPFSSQFRLCLSSFSFRAASRILRISIRITES